MVLAYDDLGKARDAEDLLRHDMTTKRAFTTLGGVKIATGQGDPHPVNRLTISTACVAACMIVENVE